MRRQLVDSQVQKGEAAGSWMTDQSVHSHMGGRLYTTCLSILTLEVYYRYLPVYRKQAALTDDPEDLQVPTATDSDADVPPASVGKDKERGRQGDKERITDD
jgi:hypothetical protein